MNPKNAQSTGVVSSILAIAHASEIKFPSRNLSAQQLQELLVDHLKSVIGARGIQRLGGMNLTTNAVVKSNTNEQRETTRFSVNVKAAAQSPFAQNGNKKAAKRMANQKPNLFGTFEVDPTTKTVKLTHDSRFSLTDKLVQAAVKAQVIVLIEQKNLGTITELKFNCAQSEKVTYAQAVWNYQTNQLVQSAPQQIQSLPVNPTGIQIPSHGIGGTAIQGTLVSTANGQMVFLPNAPTPGMPVTPVLLQQATSPQSTH